MTDSISDLVPVTLIYDTTLGSPPESAPLANQIILVPPEMFPLPTRGTVYGQPGFSRQIGDAWQWVMGGTTDPVSQFVDTLTAKGVWVNQTAKSTVMTLVQRLFSAGIPRSTISSQLPAFYQAVAAEVLAEQTASQT
jgi:hypothetical protein